MSEGTWLLERQRDAKQAARPKPATYTLRQVGELLGLSYEQAWAHAKAGELPEVIQACAIRYGGGGHRWAFPKSIVNQALGIPDER